MVLEKSWRKTETKGSGGKTNQLVYSRIPLPSTQIKSPSAGENLNPALWEPSDTDDVWLPSEGNVLGFFFFENSNSGARVASANAEKRSLRRNF